MKAIREALDAVGMAAPDTNSDDLARKVAAAWLEVAAIEKAAQYAAYGRIPGVPSEQKHFMDTMLAIADEAKAREEA